MGINVKVTQTERSVKCQMRQTQEGWLHVRKVPGGGGACAAGRRDIMYRGTGTVFSTSHKEHKEKITWKRLEKLRGGGGMQGEGQPYTALSEYLS